MEIVLASTNIHKVRELREMCRNLKNIDFLSLRDFPEYVQIEETGETLQENATLKAVDAARVFNKWVIAEDSGLFVPALNGSPGVYSARYASLHATDSENRKKLLKELAGMPDFKRVAYFECCIVLASPTGVVKTVIGRCEGTIADGERGGSGFGYDSIFIKNDSGKTFGELEESVKNRISHRRKALEKLLPTLEAFPP